MSVRLALLAGASIAVLLVGGCASIQSESARSAVEGTHELAANRSVYDTQATAPIELAPDSNEIVILGQRMTKPPLSEGFEGNLGDDMVTTEKGAGGRCTTLHTGRSICAGAAQAPGSAGVQTDWSDWSF
jgi:hypothetical protein